MGIDRASEQRGVNADHRAHVGASGRGVLDAPDGKTGRVRDFIRRRPLSNGDPDFHRAIELGRESLN